MNKKTVAGLIIALLIIISGFIAYKLFWPRHSGFDIVINNNTSETIRGLVVTYDHISKDIQLPDIEAGKIYKINIDPKEDFGESSMILYYKDNRGFIQKNVIIGYFEKGNRGTVKVNIKSRDENGLIMMQVEEKI
jgi:hypothetical protein